MLYICWIFRLKNAILLSRYFNFYLKTRKNNVVIKKYTYKNLSLNVKIQTTYTTKLEYFTLYDVNEKEIKCTMF